MASLNLDLVRHALDVARQAGMQEIELEVGDSRFTATLEKSASKRISREVQSQVQDTIEEPISTVSTKPIKCASVGIFRSVGEMLKIGTQISSTEVVGSIVALGISNDIVAGINGVILEVLVEDNQPVEYGQVVAVVEVS